MARRKRGAKMAAVKAIVAANPKVTASEISRLAKAEHGVDIHPKMAGTYRYHILKGERTQRRKAARAIGAGGNTDGLDHLLRAAEKLGWKRVKEIVEGVLNAPA